MASIIRVKRSTGTAAPGTLNYGEVAYTIGAGTQGNRGQRLFVGDNSTNPQLIGGEYYTDLLQNTPGTVRSGANTGTASTSITSLDSSGSTIVGIGTSFIDNVYSIQSFENHPTSISGITTYVRRVYVNTQSLITYGSGISTSDYFGEYSWGKITLSARTGINSYTAYTLNGIGTAASGISTSSKATST